MIQNKGAGGKRFQNIALSHVTMSTKALDVICNHDSDLDCTIKSRVVSKDQYEIIQNNCCSMKGHNGRLVHLQLLHSPNLAWSKLLAPTSS